MRAISEKIENLAGPQAEKIWPLMLSNMRGLLLLSPCT